MFFLLDILNKSDGKKLQMQNHYLISLFSVKFTFSVKYTEILIFNCWTPRFNVLNMRSTKSTFVKQVVLSMYLFHILVLLSYTLKIFASIRPKGEPIAVPSIYTWILPLKLKCIFVGNKYNKSFNLCYLMMWTDYQWDQLHEI